MVHSFLIEMNELAENNLGTGTPLDKNDNLNLLGITVSKSTEI